jgi:HEAT repeat protein
VNVTFDERDREDVARDLSSPDEDVRRLAVERIGALESETGLQLLSERLGDASWRVRKAVVERLVAWPDTERVVAALIEALADGENPGRRNSAVEALVHCGGPVVPGLLAALASDDSDVRKFVVDALAGIADPRATDRLLGLLRDSDPNVRAAAADALGVIGGAVSEPLLRVSVDAREDATVRFSALRALGLLEAPVRARELAPVLEDSMLRAAGLDLLGRCEDDEEAVAVLLKGLVSDSRTARESAMRSLLRLLSRRDDSACDHLVERIRDTAMACDELVLGAVERLADADLATRLVIVQFLGLLEDARAAVPVLVAGRDEALAQVALETLAGMGETAEAAVDAAWSDLDDETRRDACVLFGRSGGERGVARLLASLEDAEPELRATAARSIGELRVVSALPLLVHRLERAALQEEFESEDEVLALTRALADVAEPRPGAEEVTAQAVELLRSRLHGAAETVRLAMAKVLGCIGRREDTQLVAFLLKDPSALVRRAAVDALARLEPGTAAEPLRLALADEEASVRIAAAVALGASRSDAVIEDLGRLAEDEDPRVRAAAVRALGLRFGSAEPSRPSRPSVVPKQAAWQRCWSEASPSWCGRRSAAPAVTGMRKPSNPSCRSSRTLTGR